MRWLGLVLLNVYFYTLFLVSSAVVIPVLTALVAFWRLFNSHRSTMRRFRRAISLYGVIVTRLPYPFIRLVYEDHSGGGPDEGYIFVANHRSASDAFLMCVLPHEAVQVVNTWPFRIPILGLYAKWSGYLNVKNMPADEFFARAGELLRGGTSMIFFPEGTRSGSAEMGSFHGSAFRLALQENAPISPLCISGNERIPPRGSLLLRPGTIRVRRLPALRREDYQGLTAFALKNRVRETIQRELDRMEGRA